MRTDKIHYLRPNHKESSPYNVLFFDTETRKIEDGERDLQVLRVWCAERVVRHLPDNETPVIECMEGRDKSSLLDAVEQCAKHPKTLWVYAHNIAFDMTVTRLPMELIRRGWTLTEHALYTDAPWARFKRGSHRIVLVDAFSVLPTSVESLGNLLGIGKPELPDNEDSNEAWMIRCRADTKIMSRSILQCMDWWDKEQLGNWTITGPSIGWSSFRHKRMVAKIVIDPDQAARKFERSGIMGGRREVWRTGNMPYGAYLDLDFVHAHLSICANEKLPYKRVKEFDTLPLDSFYLRSQSLDVMAEVTLRVNKPRYPLRLKHGIFYPTGDFKTILAGPEIRDAIKRGELIGIGKGYIYQMAHIMNPWATWVMDILDGVIPDVPTVVKVMAKGWSRTVPGRWATRTSEKVVEYEDVRLGWHIEEGFISPGRRPAVFMTIDGTKHVYAKDIDADDAFPAVLAWIQSHCRAYLGKLIDCFGQGVIQANTDGVLIDAAALLGDNKLILSEYDRDAEILARDATELIDSNKYAIAPLDVRVKRMARRVEILSPQHIKFDGAIKFAGIPSKARQTGRTEYTFTVWPKIPYQLQHGDQRGYVQTKRSVDVGRIPVNRWKFSDGRTGVVDTRLGVNDSIEVQPPHWQQAYDNGIEPRELQHKDLQGAMRDG